jgi:hypothetical protein
VEEAADDASGAGREVSASEENTMGREFGGWKLMAGLLCAAMAAGCGASSSSGGSTGTNAYAAAYKAAAWSSTTVTVSYPSACEMTYTTTGVPPFHNDYYLAPVSAMYPNGVAKLPLSGTEVSLLPYSAAAIEGNTVTVNICPAKAATTTAANLGVIGYTLDGEALFNPYEASGTIPALADNVSYTFTDGSGNTQTAYFIDQCNSHSNGTTWHYHGVPSCLTATVDGSGPSHLLGFALDGFPIYGGRDIDGNVVPVSALDACNGITSATPEFPSGAYHYVLPIGVTTKQSSLGCYSGTVSAQTMTAETHFKCKMKGMQ